MHIARMHVIYKMVSDNTVHGLDTITVINYLKKVRIYESVLIRVQSIDQLQLRGNKLPPINLHDVCIQRASFYTLGLNDLADPI